MPDPRVPEQTRQATHSQATRRALRLRILRRLDPDVQRREYRAPLARLVELLLDQVDGDTFRATFPGVKTGGVQ